MNRKGTISGYPKAKSVSRQKKYHEKRKAEQGSWRK